MWPWALSLSVPQFPQLVKWGWEWYTPHGANKVSSCRQPTVTQAAGGLQELCTLFFLSAPLPCLAPRWSLESVPASLTPPSWSPWCCLLCTAPAPVPRVPGDVGAFLFSSRKPGHFSGLSWGPDPILGPPGPCVGLALLPESRPGPGWGWGPRCAGRWEKDTATGHQRCLVVHARSLQAFCVGPEKTQNSTCKQRAPRAMAVPHSLRSGGGGS